MLKPDGAAIINVDDPYSKEIAAEVETEVIFYGFKEGRHELKTGEQEGAFSAFNIDSLNSMQVKIDSEEIKTNLIGEYNVYNIYDHYNRYSFSSFSIVTLSTLANDGPCRSNSSNFFTSGSEPEVISTPTVPSSLFHTLPSIPSSINFPLSQYLNPTPWIRPETMIFI